MTPTPEQIAKGLTPPQEWAVRRIDLAPTPYECLHGQTRVRLFQKGILECADLIKEPVCFRLTELGLSVRAILEAQNDRPDI